MSSNEINNFPKSYLYYTNKSVHQIEYWIPVMKLSLELISVV